MAGKGRSVYIIEKNNTFGKETSSRNSETIHAGIYYPEGSLKSKTCVEGNALLYEICQRCGIGYRRIGKLIVANDKQGTERLNALFEQGNMNGARDLSMISGKEIREGDGW